MTKYISFEYSTIEQAYVITLGKTTPNVFTFDERGDAMDFLINIAKELYV